MFTVVVRSAHCTSLLRFLHSVDSGSFGWILKNTRILNCSGYAAELRNTTNTPPYLYMGLSLKYSIFHPLFTQPHLTSTHQDPPAVSVISRSLWIKEHIGRNFNRQHTLVELKFCGSLQHCRKRNTAASTAVSCCLESRERCINRSGGRDKTSWRS